MKILTRCVSIKTIELIQVDLENSLWTPVRSSQNPRAYRWSCAVSRTSSWSSYRICEHPDCGRRNVFETQNCPWTWGTRTAERCTGSRGECFSTMTNSKDARSTGSSPPWTRWSLRAINMLHGKHNSIIVIDRRPHNKSLVSLKITF